MLGYATRYYADNYEEVHSGDNVYYYYYIHTPDGLTNVAEKKNSTITVYSAETDYLGSIVSMYNYKVQTVFRAEYDAWGKQNVVTDNLARFQRGYCGHEHWQEFGLIDMNGRMYDPVIARFLSPDPFVQAPEDLQNYNRYSYCLNNPLKYTDPSGESIVAATIAIGAIIGGISGYLIGHEKNASGWGMAGYIAGGAAIGGLSGSVACGISAVGGAAWWAGAAAGAISGSGFSGLTSGFNGKEMLRGGLIGAASGFVGGAFGSAIGGGMGAFAGGAASNATNQVLSGNYDNMNWGNILISGATSMGMYYGMSLISWKSANLTIDGYKLSYRQFNTIQADYQRSRFWGKEYGGILTKNGGVVRIPYRNRHNMGIVFTSSEINQAKNEGGIATTYHTHWHKPGVHVMLDANQDFVAFNGSLQTTANEPSLQDIQDIATYFGGNNLVISRSKMYLYNSGFFFAKKNPFLN